MLHSSSNSFQMFHDGGSTTASNYLHIVVFHVVFLGWTSILRVVACDFAHCSLDPIASLLSSTV